MRITVPAGGVGAARFLRGLKAEAPDAEITVIGNTGDDITLFGLHVSPDLDTVMYTLGGGIDEEQGWGRSGDSYTVLTELAAYGAGPGWFSLGDADIATHVHRTSMLAAGMPLSAVTEALCRRWQPGVRLLPMSDDPIETHVELAGDEAGRTVHFQEWWVRMGAEVPARGFVFTGAEEASPAPGVLDAIAAADVILLPPSNPVVSIGTILAVPGIAAALHAKTVVGVSPIIGGAPVRGMADKCLAALAPLKRNFRRHCRDSGFEFGLNCVGSSLGLMLMLTAMGVMSVTWMFVIAVIVSSQKLLPPRAAVDVPVGLAIVALGILILMAPSSIPGLTPPM